MNEHRTGRMSTDEFFMRRAIEIARSEMLENGAAPFAAVVAKAGEIVGEGVNCVVANHDPTSHGEIEAMRAAGRALGTWDLSGCTLYASCEPCKMCVAAMYWARIDRIYYACRLADVEALGFDLRPLTELVRSDVGTSTLPAGQLLEEDGRAVLALWPKQPSFEAWRPHQTT